MRGIGSGVEYVLTLDSQQAREILKVVELLERWKLKQSGILSYMLLDVADKDYCEKRDKIVPLISQAMDIAIPEDPANCGKLKDDEWHMLYNITQVLRYAVHEAEHPGTTGVDSYPPWQSGGMPMPKCEWRKTEE